MRTLEQALADRKTEKDRAKALAAEKRHQECLERQRQQQRVVTLFQSYIEEEYNLEWPERLELRVVQNHPGSFSVDLPLGHRCGVELVNPVLLHEEQDDPLIIMPLRHTEVEWKAKRDGLYYACTNFLDALIYAMGDAE